MIIAFIILTKLFLQSPPLGQSGPMAEVGPEAEQHREALQLLSINLERRWEAIVMQALQWQNRLKRELGEQQVRALWHLHILHSTLQAVSWHTVTLSEHVRVWFDAKMQRERQMVLRLKLQCFSYGTIFTTRDCLTMFCEISVKSGTKLRALIRAQTGLAFFICSPDKTGQQKARKLIPLRLG